MSKRLIRIFAPQLPDRLPGLLEQEVSVVLRNGKTFFGYLDSHTSHKLILRDLRGHEHPIELSEIEVVVLDRTVLI
jgi:small nuclear ribonucleoprotein (snRNP)-like protein